MDKICCIYKVINNVNDMIYIGATNNLHRRKIEHKRHASKDGGYFHEDILKFGYDKFHYEIIEECEPCELFEKEKYYIKLYREQGLNLYNICKGGLGGQTHDVFGENNPMWGREKTQQEKEHLSKMLSGTPKPEGFGEKISKAMKGKKKSPEAVAKRSHPIKIINIETNEILQFKSKNECRRMIGVDGCEFTKNPEKIFKQKYKLYIEKDEYTNKGQTTIESIAA